MQDLTVTTHGQDFAAQSLFTAQDAENDTLTQFAFWNTGTGGAHFLLNGTTLPINQEHRRHRRAALLAALHARRGLRLGVGARQ